MSAKPYAAPAIGGLVVRQKAVKPASQFRQKPQAMLNGRQTISPIFIRSTAFPTSATSPMFSWPSTRPGSMSVRPSHVQVGAADVRGCDPHQHVCRFFDFCVSNIFHFDIAWSVVDDC